MLTEIDWIDEIWEKFGQLEQVGNGNEIGRATSREQAGKGAADVWTPFNFDSERAPAEIRF